MAVSPVIAALVHVWQTLAQLQVPMAIMGGLALASWKHARSTHDVDLLVGIRADSLDDLITLLQQAQVRLKSRSTPRSLGDLEIIQFLYEPPESFVEIQVDVLIGVSDYHKAALERRVSITLGEPATDIAVLSCEDLILHKLLAGRIIDRADAAALLRANRDGLDVAYLREWSARLGLDGDLQAVYQESLPGEPLP